MANQRNGRHRADVEIDVFEQIEIRSRRELRHQERAKQSAKYRRALKKQAKLLAKQGQPVTTEELLKPGRSVIMAKAKPKFSKSKKVRSFFTMLTSAGMLTTVALPSYAFTPEETAQAGFVSTSTASNYADGRTQTLTIAAQKSQIIDRLHVKQIKASVLQRSQLVTRYNSYSGPTAADFVKNPPYSKLDPNLILKEAAKYVGTPYVFGGANPNGFDCSGYILFVFAHFGIELPHTVSGQAAMGIPIRKEDGRPGDLVIFNNIGHSGIYAGNGLMYHSPRPGDTVKLAVIWTDAYYLVRLKTK